MRDKDQIEKDRVQGFGTRIRWKRIQYKVSVQGFRTRIQGFGTWIRYKEQIDKVSVQGSDKKGSDENVTIMR